MRLFRWGLVFRFVSWSERVGVVGGDFNYRIKELWIEGSLFGLVGISEVSPLESYIASYFGLIEWDLIFYSMQD